MTLAASIVPLMVSHWPQVEAIYTAGIATGDVASKPNRRAVTIDALLDLDLRGSRRLAALGTAAVRVLARKRSLRAGPRQACPNTGPNS
jgi:hypothetical protein